MIANFDQLATTSLRKQALLISEAGLSALALRPLLDPVWYDGRRDTLVAHGQKFSLDPYQHVIVVGLGTGSFMAVSHLANTLGNRLTAGMIIDEHEGQLPRILSRRATPQLSIANQSITKELMALAQDCHDDDVIITVLTGGNDYLTAPAGMMLEDKRSIINHLINAGASPAEINIVKKHLSAVKGGNLAKLSYPAAMINLIFETEPEVLGNPTIKDLSTVHEAREIINRYNILARAGLSAISLFETPKEDRYFERVSNMIVPVGEYARQAMANKARDLGYRIAKSEDLGSVKPGEAWFGQGSLGSVSVNELPEDGVLLNFNGQHGKLLDSGTLASARRAGLDDLDAENWAENVQTSSSADRFTFATRPLSLYLRP